jgi:hypothetical protein
MNDHRAVIGDADHELEALAAELTSAAYAIALRHGVEDKWLDVQLELWAALKETVKKWGQEPPTFSDMPFVCDWAQVSPKACGVFVTDSATVMTHEGPFSGK